MTRTQETSFQLHFLGIGPQKNGSTWLHEVLACHPQILLPSGTKETMFFDKYYDKGEEWYAEYFPETNDPQQRIGEVGPTYFTCEKALERIKNISPNCKIIVSLRNPVARAISLHHHHLNKGRVSPVFQDAIQKMPEIIESGHYSQYLPNWINTFGSSQVHLVFLDDIQNNKQDVWQGLCKFLEIDLIPMPNCAHEKVNAKRMSKYPWLARIGVEVAIKMREYKLHGLVETLKKAGLEKIYSGGEERIMPLPTQDLKWLSNLYEKDTQYLEQLTHKDLSCWREL